VMGNDNRADYEVILVDYDEDLFAPPEWIGNNWPRLGRVGWLGNVATAGTSCP